MIIPIIGYTLFCYDLSPDLNPGDHLNLVKKGNLRLEMRFSQALPQTIMVIVYAQFQNILEVDKQRNILLEYNV